MGLKTKQSIREYIAEQSAENENSDLGYISYAELLTFGLCEITSVEPRNDSDYSYVTVKYKDEVTRKCCEHSSKGHAVGDIVFYGGTTGLIPDSEKFDVNKCDGLSVDLYGPYSLRLSFYDSIDNPSCPEAFGKVIEFARKITNNGVCDEKGLTYYGLFLHGRSFLGKTTAAYLAMLIYCAFRPICSSGFEESPVWLEADAFGDTAKQKAKLTQLSAWLDELSKPNLLIIDDLDKFSLSESVEAALFGLIKRRIELRRFTIITANQSALKIVQQFEPNRREPILNRIKKFFLPIYFKYEQ